MSSCCANKRRGIISTCVHVFISRSCCRLSGRYIRFRLINKWRLQLWDSLSVIGIAVGCSEFIWWDFFSIYLRVVRATGLHEVCWLNLLRGRSDLWLNRWFLFRCKIVVYIRWWSDDRRSHKWSWIGSHIKETQTRCKRWSHGFPVNTHFSLLYWYLLWRVIIVLKHYRCVWKFTGLE